MFSDKQQFINEYLTLFSSEVARDFEVGSLQDKYWVLCKLISGKARKVKNASSKRCVANNEKKVYYFSMEFLIGKLLDNYLINFGVRDIVEDGLAELGVKLDDILEQEKDPGLGNGGLGRLAACFIDSMASLGIAGHGNGIRYRYGLFKQEIKDGVQKELPDNWLKDGYPWERKKLENAVVVQFGGEVKRHNNNGKYWYGWEGGEKVLAVPYDVPVVGFGGETVNNLRLWSAQPYEENFDMDAFNRGDYAAASKFRADVEAITDILYPNDSSDSGKILRIKQEYLFVAAGLSNILATYLKEYGPDWKRLPDMVSIHTNDTHPALCVPELMRLLIDDCGVEWGEAWDITCRTISYTNHTVLPEALEKWPIDMLRKLLPRVYMIIEEIDRRYRDSFPRDKANWQELLKQNAILWDGQVRMANLSIIGGHSVNGVASIHSEILKRDVLNSFYQLSPEKFNNKTNGISHRRFLIQANPALSSVITEAIGDGWKSDASRLEELIAFEGDAAFLQKVGQAKRVNKERFAKYLLDTTGVIVDPDSIFDVQVKRFHAYKRQLLNIFKVIDLYERLINDPGFDMPPTTFVFAGKAAQGYAFAKDVIRLINSAANVINYDPRAKGRINIVFVPNFSVSNAQLIYPAADISEQISTAGKEASGTGNMKFMMNGAITLGTFDGANVEISEQAGMDNVQIFGLRVEDIETIGKNGSYFVWDEYNRDARLKKVVDSLTDGSYKKLSGGFEGIYDNLMRSNDEFFVLKDFKPYVDAWEELARLYDSRNDWNRIALHNIAKSGYFSSDRTIMEYAKEIWRVK